MTNPDNAASTFADKVADAVKSTTRSADNKLVLPEGVSEEVAYAATAEIRRRDTQAKLTQTTQKAAALEAERPELLKHAASGAVLEQTPERIAELEDLKFSDPEKWRTELAKDEAAATKKRTEEIQAASTKGAEAAETTRRKAVLEDFNASNPESPLTADVIANESPPRLTKQLENNEITFEDFLTELDKHLAKPKVIADGQTAPNDPDLSEAGGGDRPSEDAVNRASSSQYETELY